MAAVGVVAVDEGVDVDDAKKKSRLSAAFLFVLFYNLNFFVLTE